VAALKLRLWGRWAGGVRGSKGFESQAGRSGGFSFCRVLERKWRRLGARGDPVPGLLAWLRFPSSQLAGTEVHSRVSL